MRRVLMSETVRELPEIDRLDREMGDAAARAGELFDKPGFALALAEYQLAKAQYEVACQVAGVPAYATYDVD